LAPSLVVQVTVSGPEAPQPWEEDFYPVGYAGARALAAADLAHWGEVGPAEAWEAGWRVAGKRPRTVVTRFGAVIPGSGEERAISPG